MLIFVTIIITLSHIFNAYTLNVRIFSPFPVMIIVNDGQGVNVISSNETLNINSSSIQVQAYVLSSYSYTIFINGNETDRIRLNLSNIKDYNLTIEVIPKYSYLRVNVVGKGYVNVDLPNGSIIRVYNSSVVKIYNGSTILLQAVGNLINWSNKETSNVIWYYVVGNSSIAAYFGKNQPLGIMSTSPSINFTDIALSLFAVGFFLLYKIYSKKDQDTNG
ncbi:hypothetical protein SACC_20740 [Saccharolobus caldissimus]|uniref:Uncharacterized protein n=1 Tax=Saccharolobus caldissimus TaxID=1702097 RepID=A0AAQ4CTC6_9CREN|nr:hypothetical protein SACC_20740 [Saccharolobus caldissimus]